MPVERPHVLDSHKMALLLCEHSSWRMSADIGAVAAMVVDIDVVACCDQDGREAFIACGMFGKAVAYLDNGSRCPGADGAEREF